LSHSALRTWDERKKKNEEEERMVTQPQPKESVEEYQKKRRKKNFNSHAALTDPGEGDTAKGGKGERYCRQKRSRGLQGDHQKSSAESAKETKAALRIRAGDPKDRHE